MELCSGDINCAARLEPEGSGSCANALVSAPVWALLCACCYSLLVEVAPERATWFKDQSCCCCVLG